MSADAGDLTLEQQIGQLFVAGFHGTNPSAEMLDLVRRRHIGGIILFSRNIRSAQQTLTLTNALQEAAHTAGHPAPLLIMTDQENGLVRRLGHDSTIFPGNMALGAAASERLAHDVAAASGRELAAQGVNINLAPVVDVNSNPENPVIGVRSFGENPEIVGRLGVAAMRGYHSAGVIATLKHFPGHGDTAVDSHLALPTIPATRDRLDRLELIPFLRGIEAGAECVMVAHVALPALMPPGDVLPASLSPAVVRDLLRLELGFDGVVMTDCLEMNAVSRGLGVAAGAVKALAAGNDLVLISHRIDRQLAGLEAALDAARSGTLPAARIREAAGRVLRLKRRRLSWGSLPTAGGLDVVGSPSHRQLAAEAYAASITLIRDRDRQLPLRLNHNAHLLVIAATRPGLQVAPIPFDDDALLASIRRYHERASVVHLTPETTDGAVAALADAARTADAVLLVTVNAYLDSNLRRAISRVTSAFNRIVGLAAGAPYDAGILPDVGAYLASYDYSPPALDAGIDVTFGASAPRGRLPVSLPSTSP